MKKNYITPSLEVTAVATLAMIAESNIDYGGSNKGDDAPKEAETKVRFDIGSGAVDFN